MKRIPGPVDWGLLVLRLALGGTFILHGAQKLFGAFGGAGMEKTVETMGPLAYPVVAGEFFGGLGLIVGFLCRFSAAALIVIMIGAIAQVHAKNGFFLQNGGFEYNLVLIAVAVGLLVSGPGGFSLHEVLEHLAEGRGPRRVLRKFRPSPLLRVLKLVK